MLTKELEETLGAAVDEAVVRRHEYGARYGLTAVRIWKNSLRILTIILKTRSKNFLKIFN
jgi:hypothetical protein